MTLVEYMETKDIKIKKDKSPFTLKTDENFYSKKVLQFVTKEDASCIYVLWKYAMENANVSMKDLYEEIISNKKLVSFKNFLSNLDNPCLKLTEMKEQGPVYFAVRLNSDRKFQNMLEKSEILRKNRKVFSQKQK